MYMTYLEGEEHRQKLAAIANQHAVADTRQLFLHRVLNWNWGNILAPGRYQQFCNSTEMLILFKPLNASSTNQFSVQSLQVLA